jgi:hypothetical protein
MNLQTEDLQPGHNRLSPLRLNPASGFAPARKKGEDFSHLPYSSAYREFRRALIAVALPLSVCNPELLTETLTSQP